MYCILDTVCLFCANILSSLYLQRAELIEPFLDISVPIPEYNTVSYDYC